jgi:hypothetical protein
MIDNPTGTATSSKRLLYKDHQYSTELPSSRDCFLRLLIRVKYYESVSQLDSIEANCESGFACVENRATIPLPPYMAPREEWGE